MALEVHREIDPNFYVPDGLKNTTTVLNDDAGDNPWDDENYDLQNDVDDLIDDDIITDRLPAPTSIQVLSQTIRTSSDGTQVVDIEIEVEDVPGAFNYEIRLTKI